MDPAESLQPLAPSATLLSSTYVTDFLSCTCALILVTTHRPSLLQVQESVRQASYTVVSKSENVSGVVLPTFEGVRKEGGNDFTMTGLGRGGQQVQKCRETYVKAVETLVELASLQVRWVLY